MKIETNVKAGGIVVPQRNLAIRSNVKAGGIDGQHNETLSVRSDVKAGGREVNHNQTLVIRSDVKAGDAGDAGRIYMNHNESFRRSS